MKTIPSLVASSTVGVAAAGLAFGRPQHSLPPPSSSSRNSHYHHQRHSPSPSSRPPSARPHATDRRDTPSPVPPRPATSADVYTTPVHSRAGLDFSPSLSHLFSSARHAVARSSTASPVDGHRRAPHPADTRDDGGEDDGGATHARWLSSGTGSVRSTRRRMRRLSIIPVSEKSSPPESLRADSPSPVVIGAGSTRPESRTAVRSGKPNKLVKRQITERASSQQLQRSASLVQSGSLRRPATSHQRSATLQQFVVDEPDHRPASAQQHASLAPEQLQTPLRRSPPRTTTYRRFFQVSWTRWTRERTLRRSTDASPEMPTMARRIVPDNGIPTLLKPELILTATAVAEVDQVAHAPLDSSPVHVWSSPLSEEVPDSTKQPRHASSMQFSSPTSWILRAGSIRLPKRSLNGGRRNMSSPTQGHRTAETPTHAGLRRDITDPGIYRLTHESMEDVSDPFTASDARSRMRNNSSPLPPITRLPSLSMDVDRLALAEPKGHQNPISSHSASPLANPDVPDRRVILPAMQRRRYPSLHVLETLPSERGSTLVGSDHDNRGFVSGDDEDTDFQSETIFDSYRTGNTGSVRSQNPPLEFMFDDSPPSASFKKTNLQDLIAAGVFLDVSSKIDEEDETISTPVKVPDVSGENGFSTPVREDADATSDGFPASKLMLAQADFARLSIEEDDDEDWTRDDDLQIGNSLSPPSLSRSTSLGPRSALAELTNAGSPYSNRSAAGDERRRSNLFDWSEQSPLDKVDGNAPRPRTVHGKQADMRGGRVLGRRAPTALHIRSQSVPAVPDATGHREHAKLTPKFGTWGLAAKGVSEDWDNDFDFEGTPFGGDEVDSQRQDVTAMLVPAAIQASQANVKGHVGQIREICLLVEDLKRLRGQGRERGLLGGPSAHLWKEAEGIIALAIPEEEEAVEDDENSFSVPRSPTSIEFDLTVTSEDEFKLESSVADDAMTDFNTPKHTRRTSVFSPEDDIFGFGDTAQPALSVPSTRTSAATRDSSDVARSVMETMHQHRSTSDPLLSDLALQSPDKMPFDTTSLRDLVNRANALSRSLAEIIRKADGFTPSPNCSPQRERDSSPAFTRVFTDPLSSPPKPLLRSQSNTSSLNGSMDTSPSRRRLGGRMHMMTVV